MTRELEVVDGLSQPRSGAKAVPPDLVGCRSYPWAHLHAVNRLQLLTEGSAQI